jgi:hypothetical protein
MSTQTSRLNERLPFSDEALQRENLDYLLTHPEQMADCILDGSDFVGGSHKTIFAKLKELSVDGGIDRQILLRELPDDGDEISRIAASGSPDSSTAFLHNCRAQQELTARRELAASFSNAASELERGKSTAELSAFVERELEAIRLRRAKQSGQIRKLSDIPELCSMELSKHSHIVDGLIVENSLTLWAGRGGCGKSFLMMAMGVAVGTGRDFLGLRCQQRPVLYLDYEMTGASMRDRLELIAGGSVANLHIWGAWCPDPPPLVSDPRLLSIAKQEKPFIVIDPLRLAHRAEDENDSDDMTAVMADMRKLVQAGATCLFVHHTGKSEGSASRGSSVLQDLSDACLLQERDERSGLIKVKSTKARFSESISLTIKPNFKVGQFVIVDRPESAESSKKIKTLRDAIEKEPGLTQNALIERVGMSRNTAMPVLRDGTGTHWRTEPGPNNAILYFPITSGAVVPSGSETTAPTTGSEWCSGSLSHREKPQHQQPGEDIVYA